MNRRPCMQAQWAKEEPVGHDSAFLEEKVHWLGRQNAVSVHRTKDLIDATTEAWQAHKEGELELPKRDDLLVFGG